MSEIDAEVVQRLVTGRKNDGRAVYDLQAKAEVVRACLKPGVPVAGMALQCGINANLLRRWITQSMGADMNASRASASKAVCCATGF
jgi:transposase-like protein